ncbi:integrase arm-type DNA-binding domain-containing protein [Pseudomonas sp. GM50]|uniref:integrase arm-type DNA-binding domain-containing protein n=1 Tax=Pseudomonas sp. GM50 TaxID=1144332 RepID=UPI003FD389BF
MLKDKPYKLTDGKGLRLWVKPNGSKEWRYRFELRSSRRVSRLTLSLFENR